MGKCESACGQHRLLFHNYAISIAANLGYDTSTIALLGLVVAAAAAGALGAVGGAGGNLDLLGSFLEVLDGLLEVLGRLGEVFDLLANLANNLFDSGEQCTCNS